MHKHMHGCSALERAVARAVNGLLQMGWQSTQLLRHTGTQSCRVCLAVVVPQAKNEVKVLNSLNHPNIVKYYECYQERNMMHIIMEFCQVCSSHPTCMTSMCLSHHSPLDCCCLDLYAFRGMSDV